MDMFKITVGGRMAEKYLLDLAPISILSADMPHVSSILPDERFLVEGCLRQTQLGSSSIRELH